MNKKHLIIIAALLVLAVLITSQGTASKSNARAEDVVTPQPREFQAAASPKTPAVNAGASWRAERRSLQDDVVEMNNVAYVTLDSEGSVS
jgi:hypothetical protein